MSTEVENSDDYLDMSDSTDDFDMSNLGNFESAAQLAAEYLDHCGNDREQAKLWAHMIAHSPKVARLICNLIEIMDLGQVDELCGKLHYAGDEHPLTDRVMYRQKPEPDEDERFIPEGRLERLRERQKRVHEQQDQLHKEHLRQYDVQEQRLLREWQQEQRLREQQAPTQAT
jgi:ABC-type oligopeptide transport system ATPase subunit